MDFWNLCNVDSLGGFQRKVQVTEERRHMQCQTTSPLFLIVAIYKILFQNAYDKYECHPKIWPYMTENNYEDWRIITIKEDDPDGTSFRLSKWWACLKDGDEKKGFITSWCCPSSAMQWDTSLVLLKLFWQLCVHSNFWSAHRQTDAEATFNI